MKAVIDNDILLKGACYGLLGELISTICSADDVVGVLGSARFVVPKRIETANVRRDRAVALGILLTFLSKTEALEPADDEQRMAADLELTAQELGVNLDGGESQLCAILVKRALPLLLTGDKRAVTAIEKLLDADSRLTHIGGRVKCLEQVFATAVARHGYAALCLAVCAEPEIDKVLSICCSCKSQPADHETLLECLQSYINHLRQQAGRVLAP
ncbi:MAG TPA: hypothetical protein VG204_02585 [Terriglobia bacterium]|nr:hypothetical protein [Terriglobia bacterium]